MLEGLVDSVDDDDDDGGDYDGDDGGVKTLYWSPLSGA